MGIREKLQQTIDKAITENPLLVLDNGISWIWLHGFASKEEAEAFASSESISTIGDIDRPYKADTYSVRFR